MTLGETEWSVLSQESIRLLDDHPWTVQWIVSKTALGCRMTIRADLLKLSEPEGLSYNLMVHRAAITEKPGSVLHAVAEAL